MKFILTIQLGNAAMMTGADVATALIKAAHQVEDIEGDLEKADPYDRKGPPIMDLNGNKVGTWEVK